MESLPAANVLPEIEASFGYLVAECGFELTQSTEIPSMAWFARDGRVVVVAYDILRDATVEVDLIDPASGERYPLGEILAFEPHLGSLRLEGLRERSLVRAEIERLAALLAEYGRDFLSGEVDAFRIRYREALLVRGTRAAAMKEFYHGDPARARALFESLRAYWDERDREHFAQLGTGKTLQFLRRGG